METGRRPHRDRRARDRGVGAAAQAGERRHAGGRRRPRHRRERLPHLPLGDAHHPAVEGSRGVGPQHRADAEVGRAGRLGAARHARRLARARLRGARAMTTEPEPSPAPIAPDDGALTRWSRLAVPAGLLLVAVSALRWVLADLITPFGWALLAIASWAGALFTALAIVMFRRASPDGPPRPAAPALFIVIGAMLAIYGPWAELDLQARWRLQRATRERAIEWIDSTRPEPGVGGRVPLPAHLRSSSI